MARSADRLKIRVLQRGAPAGDLDDVVDLELPGASARVADRTRVPVSPHDVDASGVPEVVPVELPPTDPGAVWSARSWEGGVALYAEARPPCLAPALGSIGVPRSGESEDPPARTDRDRGSNWSAAAHRRARGLSRFMSPWFHRSRSDRKPGVRATSATGPAANDLAAAISGDIHRNRGTLAARSRTSREAFALRAPRTRAGSSGLADRDSRTVGGRCPRPRRLYPTGELSRPVRS